MIMPREVIVAANKEAKRANRNQTNMASTRTILQRSIPLSEGTALNMEQLLQQSIFQSFENLKPVTVLSSLLKRPIWKN